MIPAFDVPALRDRVASSHLRRRFIGPIAGVRFVGGPLDGITARMLASEARTLYVGWAVLTDHGPIQVLYRQSGEPGVLAFHEIDGRTCRAGG